MRKEIEKFVILFLLPVFLTQTGCSNPSSPNGNFISTFPTLAEGGWHENISQWLDLSYVEEKDIAGFNSLDYPYLASPDLYTTNAVVKNIAELDRISEISNKQDIIIWIESLRNSEGFYKAEQRISSSTFGPVTDTMLAVATLSDLGWDFPDKEKNIEYLMSLQQPDGLFSDGFKSNETQEDSLERQVSISAGVLITLSKLGIKDQYRLKPTLTALNDYLVKRIPEEATNYSLKDEKTNKLIVTIHCIALINPAFVPQKALVFLKRCLNQISSLDGNVVSVDIVNNLLDAAEALSIEEVKTGLITENIKNYLERKIFPLQTKTGGFTFNSLLIEPNCTSWVVKLASRAEIAYPHFETLINELNKRRIKSGWIQFVNLSLRNASANTYYALNIANYVGCDRFDKKLFKKNAEQTLLLNSGDPWLIYNTLMSYRKLGGVLSPELLTSIKENSIKSLGNSSGGNFSKQIIFYRSFAEISRLAGFDIPDDVKKSMLVIINDFKKTVSENPEQNDISFVYSLWVFQRVLPNEQIISDEEIDRYLHTLWTDSGGFKVTPNTGEADVFSTYLAFEMPQALEIADKNKVKDFILSCQWDYGFNAFPPSTAKEHLLQVSLMTTSMALDVLSKCN